MDKFNRDDYYLDKEYTTEQGTNIKIYLPVGVPDAKEQWCKAMESKAAELLSRKYY